MPTAGSPEHRPLLGPEQSHQAAEPVSSVDGPNHGRVLPARRPRTRTRSRHQPDVRPAYSDDREVAGMDTSTRCCLSPCHLAEVIDCLTDKSRILLFLLFAAFRSASSTTSSIRCGRPGPTSSIPDVRRSWTRWRTTGTGTRTRSPTRSPP